MKLVFAVVIAGVLGITLFVISDLGREAYHERIRYEAAHAACMRLGFPHYRIVAGAFFCLKQEHGTDVVRPLEMK